MTAIGRLTRINLAQALDMAARRRRAGEYDLARQCIAWARSDNRSLNIWKGHLP